MTNSFSMTRRQFAQGLIALGAMTALPGKALAQGAPVVIASEEDVSTLDPHLIRNNHPVGSAIWSLFDSLVRRRPDGSHEPRLATSWEMVEPTRWRFQLREGVTFQNGEAFDAEAVKVNFERMNQPPWNGESQLWPQTGLTEIVVVDPLTVDLVTSAPTVNMLYWLEEAFIGAPAYLQETDPAEVGANPVGSGPYRMVEWKQGDSLTLTASEDYWGEAPAITDVVFRTIPELSSRINELKAGSVDLVVGLTPDTADLAVSDSTEVIKLPGLRKMHMGISFNGIEPLRDPRVRQALNHAVDVDTMIETLLGGATQRLKSIVNPPNNNPDLVPFAYDPEKAKALLAEAGHTDFEIPIAYGRYPAAKEASETVAAYLQAIGLRPKVQAYETGQFMQMVRDKAFDGIYYYGWASLINPSVELVILTSDAVDNSNGYDNPEYDKLVKTASTTLDDAERAALLTEAETMVWQDCPWLYLWYLPAIYGVSKRLTFAARPDDYVEMAQSSVTG